MQKSRTQSDQEQTLISQFLLSVLFHFTKREEKTKKSASHMPVSEYLRNELRERESENAIAFQLPRIGSQIISILYVL